MILYPEKFVHITHCEKVFLSAILDTCEMFYSPFEISMGISFNKSVNGVRGMVYFVRGMSIGRFMVDRGMMYWAMV